MTKKIILAITLILPLTNANAKEDFRKATQFVDGLLQRGLFLSAELYCDEQVKRFNEDEEQLNSLNFYVSEKINVLTRFALTLPDSQRQEILRQLELWEKLWGEKLGTKKETAIRSAATQFEVSESVSFANVFRFPLQLAISDQMLGELYRYEEEIHPEKRSALVFSTEKRSLTLPALGDMKSEFYLNRALDQLRTLRETVTQIAGTGRNTRKQAEELLAVEHQIEFRTALTYRIFAMGGENGSENDNAILESPEKIDALQRAVHGFTNLALLAGKDPIILQSRLERITCLRLLLDLSEADQALEKLLESKSEFSKEFLLQVTAEAVRLDLAKGNVEQAVRRSGAGRQNSSLDPDLELARLESALSKWRLARIAEKQPSQQSPNNTPQPWLVRSLEFVETIRENFGPYWGRRAQMLLAKAAKNQATDNFQVYLQLAEDAFRRNRFSEAVDYYDLARSGAETQKDDGSAFQFALAAASIESKLAANERNLAKKHKKYGATDSIGTILGDDHEKSAMERFCEAAKKWTARKESEEIYLYGISHAGHLLSQEKLSNSEMIDLLLEFMRLWPNSSKKPEIAQRTAALLEREERFEEALQICPEFEGQAKTALEIQNLVRENRIDDALALAKSVWDQNPKSVDLQMRYGELLAMTDRPDRLRTALEFWRNIEKQLQLDTNVEKEQKQDESLWKAKEMIIRIHEKLGNRQQAKKMLDLAFLLHENRWSAEQKKRFEELRRK